MKRTLHAALVVGLSTIGVVAMSTPAAARGIGAFSGQPEVNSDWTNFSEDYGAVSCGGSSTATHPWQVALVVDSTGNYDPTVFYYHDALTAGMSCTACAVSGSGSYSCTNRVSASSGYGSMQLGTVTVNSNYYLFATCFMSLGDDWYTTTW